MMSWPTHQECLKGAVFQISPRLVIRNLIKIHHIQVGSVKDRWSQDELANPSGMSKRCCVSNFTKIGHQEPHQDHPYLQVGSVEDRWSQDELAKPSGMSQRCCVSNLTMICHQEPHQDRPYPPSAGWNCGG